MKSLAVAMAFCTLISCASAADQTCKATAIKHAGKPDSDTLMDHVWRMRLAWGLGGASHIIAVRMLIALAVLDVRFAGPDFADGNRAV